MQLLNEIEENYPEVVRLEREEINNICGVELYEGESFKHWEFIKFNKIISKSSIALPMNSCH